MTGDTSDTDTETPRDTIGAWGFGARDPKGGAGKITGTGILYTDAQDACKKSPIWRNSICLDRNEKRLRA